MKTNNTTIHKQKNHPTDSQTLFEQNPQSNHNNSLFITDHYTPATEQLHKNHNTAYKVVGQLRDSYILIQHESGLRYIDQHAMAERIAFEKLRKKVESGEYKSTTLLHPISIQIPSHQDTNHISDILNGLKFETSVR